MSSSQYCRSEESCDLRTFVYTESELWWSHGLYFECLGCGRCCRGEPGGIFLLKETEALMASRLGLDIGSFRLRFVTGRWRYPSLKERSCDGACLLLGDEQRCSMYDCRPVQCRTWPFWPEVLESVESWEEASQRCPGINRGTLWSFGEIATVLAEEEAFLNRLEEERLATDRR